MPRKGGKKKAKKSEDMCSSSTEKVTCVQTQPTMHEVTVQVIEPIKYEAIAEEDNAWDAYVSSREGPT